MVALLLLGLAASAAPSPAPVGWSLETAYASSLGLSGADAYGQAHLRASSGPVAVGVRSLGGVQPGLLGSVGARREGGGASSVELELSAGMLREAGPTAGARARVTQPLGAPSARGRRLSAIAELEHIGGFGLHHAVGVDAPLGARWTLRPRAVIETRAGDRDPALRVEMGLGWHGPGRHLVGVALSGGGRDVLHIGPGLALTIGHLPGETP